MLDYYKLKGGPFDIKTEGASASELTPLIRTRFQDVDWQPVITSFFGSQCVEIGLMVTDRPCTGPSVKRVLMAAERVPGTRTIRIYSCEPVADDEHHLAILRTDQVEMNSPHFEEGYEESLDELTGVLYEAVRRSLNVRWGGVTHWPFNKETTQEDVSALRMGLLQAIIHWRRRKGSHGIYGLFERI